MSVTTVQGGARAGEIGSVKKPAGVMDLPLFAWDFRSLSPESPVSQKTPQS